MRRLAQSLLGLLAAITMTAALLPGSSVAADKDTVRGDRLSVARAFYEAADQRPYAEADVSALIWDGYVDHHRPASDPSLTDEQVIVGLLSQLATGFPDGQHDVYRLERVSNDEVLAYWTFTGTNTGPLFGAPPTGRTVSIDGTDLLRIRKGQVVEQWHIEDLQSLTAQLYGPAG
jgi:hypothetical protein